LAISVSCAGWSIIVARGPMSFASFAAVRTITEVLRGRIS
jgi:hypothetical protein